MYPDIRINSYRCFRSFRMSDLARVNLVVGKNNCGKSSLLEAVRLLASDGDPSVFLDVSGRRGEMISATESEMGVHDPEIDPFFQFGDHSDTIGSMFEISSSDGSSYRVSVVSGTRNDRPLFSGSEGGPVLQIDFVGGTPRESAYLPLTENGGVTATFSRRLRMGERVFAPRGYFVPPDSLPGAEMAAMWDTIALTDDEPEVVESLRVVDPRIERIAFLSSGLNRPRGRIGGAVVKLKGLDRRMPLGSMGDGSRRILAICLAAIRARQGVLLVDEIDSGLHHTVLADMWNSILKTSRRLGVQVFATTHSLDCLVALAKVCASESCGDDDVSVQRIEVGQEESVRFSAAELEEVASRGLEIR